MAQQDHIKPLRRKVAATRQRLLRLAIFKAYWPLLAFYATFLITALVGGFDRTAPAIAAVMTLVLFFGTIIFVMRGMRRFTPPSEQASQHLLDRQSDLRPISSLSDRPARPVGDAQALWTRHRDRLVAELKRIRVPSLGQEWRAVDPFWMRAVTPLVILALAIVAGQDAPGRLYRALTPDYGALVGADRMVVEAWVTPPEHTGRPPLFLRTDLDRLQVPAGSEVTLRTSAHSAPVLVLKGQHTTRERFSETPDGAFEIKATITEDTRLAVRWWGERATWRLNVSPDEVPKIEFVDLPSIGPRDSTLLNWEASDDYGLEKLELSIRLKTPHPDAPDAEERVPLPVPVTRPLSASDETQIDLTRHKWAGLPVTLQLVARDGANQEGVSNRLPFILPEKLFLDPYARVAQEVRITVLRDPQTYDPLSANPSALRADALNLAAANRLNAAPPGVQKAALMLDAVTFQGERYIADQGIFLSFRYAQSLLEAAGSRAEAEQVDPLLWALALKAEYGSAADALRRLEAARRALEQALRDGASENEIKQRMQAFRDAANEYFAARMAEAIANGGEAPDMQQDGAAMGGGQLVGGQTFEDMLNALEDLTETGASDQARQLLSDITNMLQNLEFSPGNPSGGESVPGMPGQQAENDPENLPPEEQELTDAMRRLAEILREQRELNDDTLAQERGEQPNQQQGQNGSPSMEGMQPDQFGENSDAGSGAFPQMREDGDGQEGSAEGEAPGSGRSELAEEGEGTGPSGETLAERQARLGRLVEEFARENGLGRGAEGNTALEDSIDPDALEDIRRAQRRAEQALNQGNERRAARNQEMATNALSELSRDIAGELDALERERNGERSNARDPFGRPSATAGNNGEDVVIPDEIDRQRAKDILEELRRRYNESDDEEEREYLERLLDRF